VLGRGVSGQSTVGQGDSSVRGHGRWSFACVCSKGVLGVFRRLKAKLKKIVAFALARESESGGGLGGGGLGGSGVGLGGGGPGGDGLGRLGGGLGGGGRAFWGNLEN